jgi:hypothetical protein
LKHVAMVEVRWAGSQHTTRHACEQGFLGEIEFHIAGRPVVGADKIYHLPENLARLLRGPGVNAGFERTTHLPFKEVNQD